MPYDQLGAMKLDISGLIETWGCDAAIRRRVVGVNKSGRASGTYKVAGVSSVGYGATLPSLTFVSGSFPSGTFRTGKVWVQPFSGYSKRAEGGLMDETTHIMFVRKSVAVLLGEDRVSLANDSYEYDVLYPEDNPTHVVYHLQRVKRS